MKTFQQSVLRKVFVSPLTVVLLFTLFISGAAFQSCATLNALANLNRLQFKLDNVTQLRLAGIDITNKRTASDFSIADGLNLVNAFRTGSFPLTFTLNVAAKNPNERTANLSSIELTEFPWRLMIDGRETISGGITNTVAIPSGGETRNIGLGVSLDLKQFFGEKGYDDIINLALAIAGQGAAKLQLKAQPTMRTPIGSMRYPSELTIVNTEFRS